LLFVTKEFYSSFFVSVGSLSSTQQRLLTFHDNNKKMSGLVSPRARLAARTANLEQSSIGYKDRSECYNAVRGIVEGVFRSRNHDISSQTLPDVLGACVGRLMTVRFTMTSMITADDIEELRRLLKDMDPQITLGPGMTKNCELVVTVDILAGMARAQSLVQQREYEAYEERVRNGSQMTPRKLLLYAVGVSVFVLLVAWWMATPSDVKVEKLFQLLGYLRPAQQQQQQQPVMVMPENGQVPSPSSPDHQ